MPASAATAVEGGERGATRVDTAAVVDNGSLQISEQDDRLYRHITLPNKMQVGYWLAALSCHSPLCLIWTSVRRSDSSLLVTPILLAGYRMSCRALHQCEHCCRCTHVQSYMYADLSGHSLTRICPPVLGTWKTEDMIYG